MSSVTWLQDPDDGLDFVGSPETLYRVTTPVYADQARLTWDAYVSATLAGSQRDGGRFNPKGEFGALYTSDDEGTAWEETAARFKRQGVPGLSESMELIQVVVVAGRYADLREDSVQGDFEITRAALSSEAPTEDETQACLRVARAVRAMADFLISPSARSAGNNIPLFPDRSDSELRMSFASSASGRVPRHLRQDPRETW